MQIDSVKDIRLLNTTRDSKKERQERETGINPCPGPPTIWCYFCLARLGVRMGKEKFHKKHKRTSSNFDHLIQHYKDCIAVQSFVQSGWDHEKMELIR